MDHLTTCKLIWEQKGVVDGLKMRLDAESKILEGLKLDALKQLDALGLTKQHLPGLGTIYVQSKYSVHVPKTATDKLTLFGYVAQTYDQDAIKERLGCALREGRPPTLGDTMGPTLTGLVSIHSGTLNSFWASELELAKKRGDVRWALPGVGEPESYKQLATRKD